MQENAGGGPDSPEARKVSPKEKPPNWGWKARKAEGRGKLALIQQALRAQHEPGIIHVSPHLILATLGNMWGGHRTPDRYDSFTVFHHPLLLTANSYVTLFMCRHNSKFFKYVTQLMVTTTLQDKHYSHPILQISRVGTERWSNLPTVTQRVSEWARFKPGSLCS